MFGKFFFFPPSPTLWNCGLALGAFRRISLQQCRILVFSFYIIFKKECFKCHTSYYFFFPLCKMVPIVASFCMWMFTKHVRVVRCYRDKGQLVATTRNKCQKGVVVTARTDEIGKKNQVPGRKGVGKAKGTQPPGGCCTGRNTHVQHVLISHTHTKKPCNFFVSFSLSLAPGLVCPIIFTH